MNIEKKVNQLVDKYGSRDPFEICRVMGIDIIYMPLGKSRKGFFSRLYRTAAILINEDLSYEKQKTTCAHELGHIILHSELNAAFLNSNTYQITDKYEIEANEFMLELLFNENEPYPITIEEATEEYGIPEQLLKKKFYP
ncbi:ImmA/IrrE family metallo-endopeptidase [Oceanobacillus timonensis]|uniref:ImmA/IrrE family metallo-endopeptidase n=1 Tax=Oceanobacillus timonensis TaxID=1926285 RepID=UPI0009BA53AD|nr:ImmA/IrrE family metallo-endopeptidase [Oceanobacillus timonensis]